MSRLATKVTWQKGSDPRVPFVATVDGERWELRLGETPSAPKYTLVVDGEVVAQVTDWPANWRDPDDDPYQKREMELEEEKFQRTRNIKPSKLV